METQEVVSGLVRAFWVSNQGLLREQQVLLTKAPSLQPLFWDIGTAVRSLYRVYGTGIHVSQWREDSAG